MKRSDRSCRSGRSRSGRSIILGWVADQRAAHEQRDHHHLRADAPDPPPPHREERVLYRVVLRAQALVPSSTAGALPFDREASDRSVISVSGGSS